ncbi:MAG: hypothetical protein M9928_20035 [Anaerolineae bacterium]|nr:hypothetical protein [Anaerolineae bacterium]
MALTADRDIVWSDVSVTNDRDGFEALQQRLIDLTLISWSGWKRPAFTGWRCMRS